MLTIHVLDRGAEEREELITWINSLLHEDTPEIEYIPRIDLRPISLEEVKYHGTPDICIIGNVLLEDELTALAKVRKQLPTTPIIACTSDRLDSLAHIEQLARLGATDTLSRGDSASVLLRKIVLLAKYQGEKKGGKLVVVDSGKGGVGVTSIAASLAETIALQEKRVVLIDLDFETQDLSRFLQCRPFINENLQLLLEGSRTLSSEFLDQCIHQVWEDDDFLFHVSPPPESDALYSTDTKMLRTLLSFFEVLDEKFDCIIVDAGSVRGAMQKTLYRAADHVVFVLNNDPATLYSSVDRIRKIQEVLSPAADLIFVDNNRGAGLSRKVLVNEFSKASKIGQDQWLSKAIPHCKNGAKWPASGGTFVSLARQTGVEAIEELAKRVGLVEFEESTFSAAKGLLSSLKARASELATKGITSESKLESSESTKLEPALPERKALPLLSNEKSEEAAPKRSQERLMDLVESESSPTGETPSSSELEGFITPTGVPFDERSSKEFDLENLVSKATIQ